MDYLVLETMNKAITSPIFVEQRRLIERVKSFCPSAFVKAVPGWCPVISVASQLLQGLT